VGPLLSCFAIAEEFEQPVDSLPIQLKVKFGNAREDAENNASESFMMLHIRAAHVES